MPSLSSLVSVLALIVSLVSLYVSIRRFAYEKNLESAKTATDLMNMLSDNTINLRASLNHCQWARPARQECQERWQSHIPEIQSSLACLDDSYATLERHGPAVDRLSLERIAPRIHRSLRESDNVQKQLKELLEMCSTCPLNSERSCNEAKAEGKSKRDV